MNVLYDSFSYFLLRLLKRSRFSPLSRSLCQSQSIAHMFLFLMFISILSVPKWPRGRVTWRRQNKNVRIFSSFWSSFRIWTKKKLWLLIERVMYMCLNFVTHSVPNHFRSHHKEIFARTYAHTLERTHARCLTNTQLQHHWGRLFRP